VTQLRYFWFTDRFVGPNFFVVSFAVGFEALTAVSVNGTIFWDIMPCCHVEGMYCPPLQGLKNKPSKKQEGSRTFFV
jgi:hypothetical protein